MHEQPIGTCTVYVALQVDQTKLYPHLGQVPCNLWALILGKVTALDVRASDKHTASIFQNYPVMPEPSASASHHHPALSTIFIFFLKWNTIPLKTTLHLYNLHSIAHVAQCQIGFHIWLLSAEKFVLCQHMQAAVLGDQSKALTCHFPSAKKVQ